jgi:hypothetical protein
MRHFLAYGNSDQESFRDPSVRDTFDVLTIPGTIASYYPDATAAFALSCEKPYIVDPRTPLFQDRLDSPRASHFTLAEWGGPTLRSQLDSADEPRFPPSFYSPQVITELVSGMVSMQRSYATRRGSVTEKIDRYRRLLATALSREFEGVGLEAIPPKYILSPYFASRTLEDPWWHIQERIWKACLEDSGPAEISPVVAIGSPRLLLNALEAIPDGLNTTTFFWVPDFDERTADVRDLQHIWEAVTEASKVRTLVNLYGGFFSICLGRAGLDGFNNGLGYSESRAWPELSATGAAPARYYMRELHAFVPLAVAQQIVEVDSWFECPCQVCNGARTSNRVIPNLSYHDLKKHFALSREYELGYVDTTEIADIAAHLIDTDLRVSRLRDHLPSHLRVTSKHLQRWSEVLGLVL